VYLQRPPLPTPTLTLSLCNNMSQTYHYHNIINWLIDAEVHTVSLISSDTTLLQPNAVIADSGLPTMCISLFSACLIYFLHYNQFFTSFLNYWSVHCCELMVDVIFLYFTVDGLSILFLNTSLIEHIILLCKKIWIFTLNFFCWDGMIKIRK